MSKDSRKSPDEIPDVAKFQYARGRALWNYLKDNDPDFKKYKKKGSH